MATTMSPARHQSLYSTNRHSTTSSSDSLSTDVRLSRKSRGITSCEIIPRIKKELSSDSISTVSEDNNLTTQDKSWISRLTAELTRRLKTGKSPGLCDGVVGLTEDDSPTFATELVQICNALTYSSAGASARNWACDTGTFDVPSIKRKAQLQVGFSLFDTTTFGGDKSLLDDFCSHVEVNPARIEKACPHLLAGLMLPEEHFPVEARKIVASFWLWLCLVDDQIESESDIRFNKLIEDVEAFMVLEKDPTTVSDEEVSFRATKAFMLVLQNTDLPCSLSVATSANKNSWKQDLLVEIKAILKAFRHERPLMQLGRGMNCRSVVNWMKVRLVTISCRPFMVLAKASLGLLTAVDPLSDIPRMHSSGGKVIDSAKSPNFDLIKLELLVQCVAGLQNDIIGWEKDHREKNYLNCIEILILRGVQKRPAFSTAVRTHNMMMQELLRQTDEYSDALLSSAQASGREAPIYAEMKYLDTLVNFTHGMAVWHTRAKRYAYN